MVTEVYELFGPVQAWRDDTNPVIDGSHKWKLPGIKCPRCGNPWARGVFISYPWVDPKLLPRRSRYTGVRTVEPEELPEYAEPLRPQVGPDLPLPPGTSFGPFTGRHKVGALEDFYLYYSELLVSRSAWERLIGSYGLHLPATPAEVRAKRKGEQLDYVELHALPRAVLGAPKIQEPGQDYCPECGFDQRSLPKPLVIRKESIPDNEDVFRLIDEPQVRLGTGRLVQAVQELRLKGIEFERVEVI
jgi:uncharacterized double-CXXCG motif protein